MHPGQRERRGLVDRDDARGRMRTCHQSDVLRPRRDDVGGEAALADDEAPILAHATIGRHEAEGLRHALLAGRLRLRVRSAASAIASTICA